MTKCLVVLVVCFALNLIAPVVIAHQRTIAPNTTTSTTFDGPAPLSIELSTATGPKSGQVIIDADIAVDGTRITDSYVVHASSALPAAGRAGLSHVFPYRPERLSYPYSDPFAPQTFDNPAHLDYVGPGNVGGLDTYKYRANISGEGYAAERIIDLQVKTGAVLDETWSVEHSSAGGPPTGLYRMSEQSRTAAWEHAAAQVRVLRGLQVLAWVTRFVALVALVWAAVTVARR